MCLWIFFLGGKVTTNKKESEWGEFRVQMVEVDFHFSDIILTIISCRVSDF